MPQRSNDPGTADAPVAHDQDDELEMAEDDEELEDDDEFEDDGESEEAEDDVEE